MENVVIMMPIRRGDIFMDPLTLILTALTAGSQPLVTDVIKDTYAGLKTLIQRKFAGNANAEMVLTGHEADPETWTKPLKKALVETHVDQDSTISEAAQKLIDLIEAQPNGKQQVQSVINAVGNYIAIADHGSTAAVNINGLPKEL
jgi:hypothetical protein